MSCGGVVTGEVLAALKALALDVDGTLTDGVVWWGPDGAEWKRFCFADIMGVSRARRAGLVVALISGEDSELVDRFASKLKLEHVYKGVKDKAAAVQSFAKAAGLEIGAVAFMGDDVNDLPAMRVAGFAASPADAQCAVRAEVDLVTEARGGHGAVRELIELVLEAREAARVEAAGGV